MSDETSASPRRLRFERARALGRRAVADALDEARRSRGLSYRDLARQTGIVIATLQGWLSGRYVPQVGMRDKFERLVAVLDVADPPGAAGRVGVAEWWHALRDLDRRLGDADDAAPYPGMRPFDLQTAADFAGRSAALAALRARIEARLRGDEPPLLLVTGRSGVGKSSLVAAAAAASSSATAVPAAIVSPSAAAEPVLRAATRRDADAPRIVVLDQAEALWALPDTGLTERLLDALRAVQEGGDAVAVVVVARADAMASLTDVAVLREAIERHSFVLGPITADDARSIILDPTSRRGVTPEPELVSMILTEIGVDPLSATIATPEALAAALPLLSQTMRTLWEQRELGSRIGLADYRRAGGVASSIERAAERAYAELSPEARAACWPVLREMLRLDTATPTRRPVALSRFTDPASTEAIATLRDAHLLVTDDTDVSIGHDLLLRTWPRLADWLASAHAWGVAQRMLARYASFWDESGRPDDLLTTGHALGILDADHDTTGALDVDALSLTEREFLEASRAAQHGQLDAAHAENRRLRSSRRRLRSATGLAAGCAAVAILLAVAAGSAAARLDAVGTEYRSKELAARSQVVSETMPAEGAQLAIAAQRINENPTTDATLLSLSAQPQPRRLRSTAGPGALVADADVVVQGGAEHTVRVIDPTNGAVRDTIRTPASNTYALSMATAGDRRLVAATGEDTPGTPSQSCVWDIAGAATLVGCLVVPSKSDSVTVLPDGSGVLFGGGDGTIQRLRITPSGIEVLAPIPGPRRSSDAPPTAVMGLASAGGTVLAVARDGTVATLADPLGAATWSAPVVVPARSQSVTLSADGRRFAVATQAFTLELGAIGADGAPALSATAHGFESWANAAVFLPDGTIAGVSSDQTLRLFTADGILTKTQVLPSLPTAVALSGPTVATYTVNGTTTLWPEGSLPRPTTRGRIFDVATDASGGRVVASLGSGDGALRVERLLPDGSRRELRVPDPKTPTRYGVSVSPDGRLVVSAGYGSVFVWRVGDDAVSEPTVLTDVLPGALMTEVDFSPDGRRLAVGDQSENHVVVFDVADDTGSPGAGVRVTERGTVPVTTGGSMAFASSDVLVVEDGTRSLLVWDLGRGSEVGKVTFGDVQPVAIARRPGHDGQIAYTTESLQVGIVDVSDAAHPRMLGSVTGLTDTPRDVSFSSDGSRLVVATVGHVEVRPVSAGGDAIGGVALALKGPMRTEITAAKMLAGDTRMVAATYGGLLWWWDLEPARAAAAICSQIGDPLQIAEAQALASSVPSGVAMCQ